MAVNPRTNRMITIRVACRKMAKGIYAGTDRNGLTMVRVNGQILRGKPICHMQNMATA